MSPTPLPAYRSQMTVVPPSSKEIGSTELFIFATIGNCISFAWAAPDSIKNYIGE